MKERGWIKTKNQLPDPGQTVLTYPHFKVLPFGNTEKDGLEGDWSDNDFWEWDDNGGVVKARPYPTHWMPLPEKPN